MAMVTVHDDMFTDDVIADPYTYYGRLREEDPVHWNEKYALWVITRHDDVVWMTRHHELFSNAVFRNDPRPAYPAINESDLRAVRVRAAITRLTNSSSMIVLSISRCARWCTAISPPGPWRRGVAL